LELGEAAVGSQDDGKDRSFTENWGNGKAEIATALRPSTIGKIEALHKAYTI